MSAINQIEVTDNGAFLEINNTNITPARVESYPYAQMTSVYCVPLDVAAVNTFSPGTNEFDDKLEVRIVVNDNGNEIVIEIQNVTNQVTWTKDLAGLAIACADIKSWFTTP